MLHTASTASHTWCGLGEGLGSPLVQATDGIAIERDPAARA
jgi:hypothetical protein